MDYDQEQLKTIAKEYLSELSRATGWKIEKVVKQAYSSKLQLVAISQDWARDTEVDDNSSRVNPEAQKALETSLSITRKFENKYQGIKFGLAGGVAGEKLASHLIKIAKELISETDVKVDEAETAEEVKPVKPNNVIKPAKPAEVAKPIKAK